MNVPLINTTTTTTTLNGYVEMGPDKIRLFFLVIISVGIFICTANILKKKYTKYRNRKKAIIVKDYLTFVDTKNIDDNCVICLESLKNKKISKMRCGHIFHDTCIKEWLDSSSYQNCPICRN